MEAEVETAQITAHKKLRPPPSVNSTSSIPNAIRPDELVSSSISLLVVIPMFIFLLTNVRLRTKKSYQLFMNLLVVHALFHLSRFTSNFLPEAEDEFVITHTCLFVSMFLGLMLLSLERVMLITCPFTHRDITTLHSIVIMILSWVPTVLFLAILLTVDASQRTLSIITTSLIVIATLVLSVSNIMIYRAAKKHYRFKKNTTRQKLEPRRVLKASYVCFAIVASFVILWLPYLIHNIMAHAGVYQPDADKIFTKFVEHFALLNTIVDVLLFIWLSREMKKELRHIWWKMRGQERRETSLAELSLMHSNNTSKSLSD